MAAAMAGRGYDDICDEMDELMAEILVTFNAGRVAADRMAAAVDEEICPAAIFVNDEDSLNSSCDHGRAIFRWREHGTSSDATRSVRTCGRSITSWQARQSG